MKNTDPFFFTTRKKKLTFQIPPLGTRKPRLLPSFDSTYASLLKKSLRSENIHEASILDMTASTTSAPFALGV